MTVLQNKLIRAQSITKTFSGVAALTTVDFELDYGEVHALMGENGAGKSTLSKILSGAYSKDSGKIYFEGAEVNFANTKDAQKKGISIVFQEFNLLPHLSVAENIFLTDEKFYKKGIFLDKSKMVEESVKLLSIFNMENFIDPYMAVSKLSVAQMQIIEILKAVSTNAKVILLDEPTAPLSPPEVEGLFKVIRQLKSSGVSFIIVSHRINEIYEISDRITVLRDGKLVLLGAKTSELDQNDLIKAMVGREVNNLYGTSRDASNISTTCAMKVEGLTDFKNYVKDINFEVNCGEILGISGLVGAGRSELVRCIYGVDRRLHGDVYIFGEKLKKNSVKASIDKKVAFVSEDRKNEGLLQKLSVLKNIALAHLCSCKEYVVSGKKYEEMCYDSVKKFNIKLANIDTLVRHLSGGNQQKVLLAKWLLIEPKILIIDEPTRGIDIAAKSEIYEILKTLASQGMAIIMVSSEIPEVLGMCDRILVMRDGRISKELSKDEATEEKIGFYSTIGGLEGQQ